MRLDPMGRIVKVKKEELLAKIRENRAAHIKEYEEAVDAFKEMATREIQKLHSVLNEGVKEVKKELKVYQGNVDEGALKVAFNIKMPQIALNLITPEDKRDDYDKLITMFEMEVEDVVELTQGEFNQYIHDETDWAVQAKMSNSSYLALTKG